MLLFLCVLNAKPYFRHAKPYFRHGNSWRFWSREFNSWRDRSRMTIRSGLLRRFLSTFPLTSQSTVAAASASARNPTPIPSTTLFVSGLNKQTSSEKLKETFSNFGEVVQARVVTDRASGHSKGFGFVRYSTLEEAEKGIKGMDGQFLDGWVIFAEYARPRVPPEQST